jgi:DNA excision repair protein ERCC-4
MKVVQDTREKRPLRFPLEVDVVVSGLKTGDYSIVGYEDRIQVERKRLSELVNCMTCDRVRFRKQLARLKKIPYRCVVIEGDMYRLMRKRYVGYVRPQEALDMMTALMVEYRVPFYMTGSAENTAHFTLSFLRSSLAEVEKSARP